jgi:hypothetical protein
MFDFNTVPRTTVEAAAARVDLPLALLPAATGTVYRLIA